MQKNREDHGWRALPDGKKPDSEDRMIPTTQGQLSPAFNRRRGDIRNIRKKDS